MNHRPISTDIQPAAPKRESLYGVRLIQLHSTRWRLMARMEDEQQRSGTALTRLDADLASNHAETRTFLAYLSGHA